MTVTVDDREAATWESATGAAKLLTGPVSAALNVRPWQGRAVIPSGDERLRDSDLMTIIARDGADEVRRRFG